MRSGRARASLAVPAGTDRAVDPLQDQTLAGNPGRRAPPQYRRRGRFPYVPDYLSAGMQPMIFPGCLQAYMAASQALPNLRREPSLIKHMTGS